MGGIWGRCPPSARCTYSRPSCQVKIFEEDFQRERSDRERMNEEKEELKQQLEKLQKQLVLSNNQVSSPGCHGQHPRRRLVSPKVCQRCLSPVSCPLYLYWSYQLSLLEHLLSLVSSFCPSPGSVMRGGMVQTFPWGIPCPMDEEGDRVSSALIPPFSQLRASKEDCQREKEEKEKLKKLLKQHKQVQMGGKKPFLGGGTGGCGASAPYLIWEGKL